MAANRIKTATTTLVRSGSGSIKKIVIGGGAMGAITIYDALSAAGEAIWSKATIVSGDIYEIDCPISVGITVVTAAATYVTVVHNRGN